ncbi:MAG: hypothetical protein GXO91_04085 [FCB group bacterium]|nr:hypothetical protein [FCB group bacterium]
MKINYFSNLILATSMLVFMTPLLGAGEPQGANPENSRQSPPAHAAYQKSPSDESAELQAKKEKRKKADFPRPTRQYRATQGKMQIEAGRGKPAPEAVPPSEYPQGQKETARDLKSKVITAVQGPGPGPQDMTKPGIHREIQVPGKQLMDFTRSRHLIRFEGDAEEILLQLNAKGIEYESSEKGYLFDNNGLAALEYLGLKFYKLGISLEYDPHTPSEIQDGGNGENSRGILDLMNDINADIPDYQGNGNPGTAQLELDPTALGRVTALDYEFFISHSYPGDLRISIVTGLNDLVVWDRLGGPDDGGFDDDGNQQDDDIYLARTTHAFTGVPVNNPWYLYVQDWAFGDTGFIDFFRLIFYYNDPPSVYNAYITNAHDYNNNGCNEYWEFTLDVDAADGPGYYAEDIYIDVYDDHHGYWGTWGPFTFDGMATYDNVTLSFWDRWDYFFDTCTEVEFNFIAYNDLGTSNDTNSFWVDYTDCAAASFDNTDECFQTVVDGNIGCCDSVWSEACDNSYWECQSTAPHIYGVYPDITTDDDNNGCLEEFSFQIDIDAATNWQTAHEVYIDISYAWGDVFATIGPYDFSGNLVSDNVLWGPVTAADFGFSSCTAGDFIFTAYNWQGSDNYTRQVQMDVLQAAPVFWNVYVSAPVDADGDGCYEDWSFRIDIDAEAEEGIAEDVYIDITNSWTEDTITVGPYSFMDIQVWDNIQIDTHWDEIFCHSLDSCMDVDFEFYAYNALGADTAALTVPAENGITTDSAPISGSVYVENQVFQDGCTVSWNFRMDIDPPGAGDMARDVYIDVFAEGVGPMGSYGPYDFWGISGSCDDAIIGPINGWEIAPDNTCSDVSFSFLVQNDLGEIILNRDVSTMAWCADTPYGFADSCYQDVLLADSACCYEGWSDACQTGYEQCMNPCNNIAGDINQDGSVDVIDVVELVDIILNNAEVGSCVLAVADLSVDGQLNVSDIVELVGLIIA